MKKKIAIMLVLTLSTCLFCSCGKSNKKKTSKETPNTTIEDSSAIQNDSESDENNINQESSTDDTINSEIDYINVYDELLFNTYKFIVGINEETIPSDEEIGILEALREEDTNSALLKIGYFMKDLSGDGIPELLIMQINESESTSYLGSRILAAYTYKDNTPVNILVGTSRNRYYLFDDNTIYNEGSNGAAYSIFATYNLSKDGSSLITKDFYFTSPINDDYSNIGFFHNTIGDINVENSEKYEGSEDDFWKISTDLSTKIISYEVCPFEIFHAGPDDEISNHNLPINGYIVENLALDNNTCYQFIADTSENESQILLTANETVTDFHFNSLEYIESSDDTINYLMTPMYSLDEFTSDKPLVVTLTFFGTIPNYGISYTDANGIERKFALEISGMDGSLLINEF